MSRDSEGIPVDVGNGTLVDVLGTGKYVGTRKGPQLSPLTDALAALASSLLALPGIWLFPLQ